MKRNDRPLNRPALRMALGILALVPVLAVADMEPVTEAEPPVTELSLDDLRTFTDVYNLVRKNYVDDVRERDLLEAALKGMVASLDVHSAFLGPRAFEDQDDSSRGRYGGIGITLDIRNKRLVVDSVFEDGPAWVAGVQPGDVVLAVDGKPVRGRPLRRAMDELLGAPGTGVEVRFRTGKMPPRELDLVREYIPVPSIEGELVDGDVALLRVSHFHLESDGEFERKLDQLRSEAGGALAGVLIDLRDNPGGAIRSAARIADGFLDEGLVVYTRGRYPASFLEYHAEPGEWDRDVPVAVLVNRGSASASEILAGALQDHGRATIVGTRTYGKGTVQSILQLRNGSALKLTTARYFTPSGRSIDHEGIIPDVAVKDRPPEVEDETLSKALEALRSPVAAPG